MSVSKSALVVDDDMSFTAFICAALEKLAVRPDVAYSGAEALSRLRRHEYSGVLLDLKLPDIPGLDVLRAIRQRGDRVPVVVLTGAGSVPSAVEAMQLGAQNFLEKPVRLTQLSAIVQALSAAQPPRDRPRLGRESLVDQLVRAMVVVVNHSEDVATVRQWCNLVGRSRSSLYAMCELVGVVPKAALDLARLLRAARSSPALGLREAFLVADPRTIDRLLKRAGGSVVDSAHSQDDVLKNQRLMTDRQMLDRLARFLGSSAP